MKLIYRHGKDFCINKMLLASSAQKKELPNLQERIKFIEDAIVPIFPLRGKDLINMGLKNSPRVGFMLKGLEQIWENSNFQMSREELLNLATKINIEVAG